MDMIPERDPTSLILESDSIQLIEASDSASLIAKSDPTPVISVCAESGNGHVRRFSTGNLAIPYKSVKILSRYLAASTGSCHDQCKYGMRQDAETKTISSPRLERVMEKQGKVHHIGKTSILAERKKNLTGSFTSSPGSKTEKPYYPFVGKKELQSPAKKETVLVKQFSLPFNGLYPKPKPNLSKSNSSSLPIKEHSSGKEDGAIQENKEMDISYVNSRRVSVSREQTTLRRIKELKSSILDEKKVSARRSFSALYSVKKVLTRPIVSLSTKLPEKRISSATIGKSKRLKGVSRPKDHCGVGKVESERPSNVGVSKKYSSTIESERPSNEGVSKKYSSTIGSKGPSNEGTIESNVENKIVRPTQNSDSSKSPSLFPGHKSLKHAAKGISPIQSSPLAAEKILRRTRYGTHVNQSPKPSENVSLRRTKQGTHIIRSSASSLASPETIHGSKLSEPNQIDVENRAANAKVEFNTTPKKDRVVSTKEEARKLSFRTVKLLELQPGISSPRRLKFKRRFHSDSQIDLIETPKRSPKKTVLTDDVEAIVENSEREKVVLKHQDVEEKTEQSLLNNVIEETATKLAETRKSKVKALVGAFESVISLQDARPTVTVDAF